MLRLGGGGGICRQKKKLSNNNVIFPTLFFFCFLFIIECELCGYDIFCRIDSNLRICEGCRLAETYGSSSGELPFRALKKPQKSVLRLSRSKSGKILFERIHPLPPA
jgi:hypothetical protein